jgi:hypothetical protein
LAVGEVDVDALLARLTARQLTEWMAYYQLEPWGDLNHDRRMATLTALTANAHRDPKKRPEPFSSEDFMLSYTAHEPVVERHQSWQQQKAMLQALFKRKSK